MAKSEMAITVRTRHCTAVLPFQCGVTSRNNALWTEGMLLSVRTGQRLAVWMFDWRKGLVRVLVFVLLAITRVVCQ